MSKIVVTGGAGFIGSHIVDMLLDAENEVAVIDNLSSGNKGNLRSGTPLYEFDVQSEEARNFLVDFRPDILVHAAAQMSVRVSMEDPTFDTESNVLGLVNLLQAFAGIKLPQFVFMATGGARYGEVDLVPTPETVEPLPTSVYGMAKRVSELYLDLWHRVYGLTFASLRLGNIYGPRQNPHGEAGVVAIFMQKILRGEVPTINGTGDQTRDYVYVGDVVDAVKAALTKRVSGIYNIGTGIETSVNELYKIIAQTLKTTIKAKNGPAKAGEQRRSAIDSSLAYKSFGWKPAVDLKKGLGATADWFRNSAS